MEIITDETIRADIAGYRERINQVKAKLDNLPTGYLPYPKYKKREKLRKVLQAEIELVQKLISIAREGLATCEC